jgi:hypothetical protein
VLTVDINVKILDNLIHGYEKRCMGSLQAMCSAYRELVYPHFWYAVLITMELAIYSNTILLARMIQEKLV